MSSTAHDVAGTTYYSCGECGSCGCPQHRAEGNEWGHKDGCSHKMPDWWMTEDCEMFGPGRFMICSRCQYPPCRTAPEEKSEAVHIPHHEG